MALEWLKALFRDADEIEPEPKSDIRERRSAFSTGPSPFDPKEPLAPIKLQIPSFSAQIRFDKRSPGEAFNEATGQDSAEVVTFDKALESFGMDSTNLKQAFTLGQGAIPDDLFNWFSQQGFIGYQACAIISQHWLVNKALMIPAKDAVRNGYQIGSVDGEDIDVDVLAKLQDFDKKYKIPKNLIEFATNTRRFGVRLALFVVESADEDYYKKPFNIDGITPGSYKGISQVDPSWIAPILDANAAANPASMEFYEPTYWLIAGQLYHHTHLIIARYVDPPDILKPTYQYGGIPLTQLILERVYAAERTANEAPMLAETKRLNIIYTDIAAVTANPGGFQERLEQLIGYRNNYGAYVADTEDRLEQIETSLADVDDVIMGQYQLVAGVSEIPATKLIGTSPKGFNATGEFELQSYYDLLENIQTDLTRVIERHHELIIRSEKLGDNLSVVVIWNPTSSPSAKEQAEINLINAQTDNALLLSGAIDARDIRNRVISDPKSGYNALEAFEEMDEFDEDDLEFGELDGPGGSAPGAKAPPGVEVEAEPALVEVEEDPEEDPEMAEDGGLLGYVTISPSIRTGAMIHNWAVKAGIENAIRPTEYHVTLAHSAAGILDYEPDTSTYMIEPTGEIGILGAGESLYLVLFVDSPDLRRRNAELMEMGAKSKFDAYRPHISIKHNPAPGDLEKATAAIETNPIGEISMGNETRKVV